MMRMENPLKLVEVTDSPTEPKLRAVESTLAVLSRFSPGPVYPIAFLGIGRTGKSTTGNLLAMHLIRRYMESVGAPKSEIDATLAAFRATASFTVGSPGTAVTRDTWVLAQPIPRVGGDGCYAIIDVEGLGLGNSMVTALLTTIGCFSSTLTVFHCNEERKNTDLDALASMSELSLPSDTAGELRAAAQAIASDLLIVQRNVGDNYLLDNALADEDPINPTGPLVMKPLPDRELRLEEILAARLRESRGEDQVNRHRQIIKEVFPRRRLRQMLSPENNTGPLLALDLDRAGTPAFRDSVQELLECIEASARPLTITAKQWVELIKLAVAGANRKVVDIPSVVFYVQRHQGQARIEQLGEDYRCELLAIEVHQPSDIDTSEPAIRQRVQSAFNAFATANRFVANAMQCCESMLDVRCSTILAENRDTLLGRFLQRMNDEVRELEKNKEANMQQILECQAEAKNCRDRMDETQVLLQKAIARADQLQRELEAKARELADAQNDDDWCIIC